MVRQVAGYDIPPHINPKNVVEFDIFKYPHEMGVDIPHDAFVELNKQVGPGIYWSPLHGGHWFITDYKLLSECSRNTELFSSSSMSIPALKDEPKLIPLYLDPPEHKLYRDPLVRAFSPAKVMEMEPAIRAFATQLIDGIVNRGQCEFVEAIAEPFPIITFMRIMGMDTSRLTEFRSWVTEMMSPTAVVRHEAFRKIHEMMGELIHARQAKRENDLISRLLDCEINGKPVSYDEMQGYSLLLFAAGLDTVANSIGFGTLHLAGAPDLQDQLRADPSLITAAIEEILRRYGVPMPGRLITRDAEFGGVQLKAGERVLLALPAVNLDPKVFPEPERVDLSRENKTHVGFNVGPHRCIGMNLARIELKVLFQEWFKRMPNVRLDPAASPEFRPGQALACVKLPLIWDVKH